EAGKNTRNAMGVMYKICILGSGFRAHMEQLRDMGHKVRAFRSHSALLNNMSGADLIVIDSAAAGADKGLAKALREIPKIVVSEGAGSKTGWWLREPMSYTATSPTPRELSVLVSRAIKETGKIRKSDELKSELSDARDEADFFERMSHMLMTSKSPAEIFSAFLRRAVKISKADGWAYSIIDDETGELRCKRSSRMDMDCYPERNSKHCLASEVVSNGTTLMISGKSKRKKSAGKGFSIPSGPYLGVPVSIDSQVLGVLELYNNPGGRDFDKKDACMVAKFADLAARAVDNIGLQQRLEELVITDDLTKLFNTRYLNRSLDSEIQRSMRYANSVSLIFMDLDHFKDVNDVHGHLIGSKLLAEIGQLLMKQLRNLDVVARYGGDEFVVLLPQTPLDGAMVIAERIRERIEKSMFLKKEGMNFRITASFGVATYPETAKSKEELIRIADDSMYNVKKNNRNGVYAIISDGTI
ncbi:MAG: GGDEF domain-containing protein, partial [Thermodesulfovibrionales bacterium]|nr:GGDEF domain-containing protein [Thermodesulfovibrionales bacterium]